MQTIVGEAGSITVEIGGFAGGNVIGIVTAAGVSIAKVIGLTAGKRGGPVPNATVLVVNQTESAGGAGNTDGSGDYDIDANVSAGDRVFIRAEWSDGTQTRVVEGWVTLTANDERRDAKQEPSGEFDKSPKS